MELPLPPPTRYDQAARYLLVRANPLLFEWLLHKTPEQVQFGRWLPTQLTLPGAPQRLCDGIADLLTWSRAADPSPLFWKCRRNPTRPCRAD